MTTLIQTLTCVGMMAATVSARDVTLIINTTPPFNVMTNEVTIAANESVQLVSWRPDYYSPTPLVFIKDGQRIVLDNGVALGQVLATQNQPRIAGPAIVRLETQVRTERVMSFCTLQITPDPFPPGQAFVLPAGPGGANIALEASHDLIHWTNAPPGLYTNPPANLFFRIRAERVP